MTLRLDRWSAALLVLMAAQSFLGLLLPDAYRDVAWIRATWFGNVATFVTALAALATALIGTDAERVAARLSRQAPVRTIGAYFVFVATGLAGVWTAMWAAHVFAGRPTPVEPEAFRLVAALDLSLMVPALALGGVLLWRRHPWGVVVSTAAGVQATLYLLVLSLNSVVAIRRGLAVPPGELPIWAPLFVATGLATWLLLVRVQDERA